MPRVLPPVRGRESERDEMHIGDHPSRSVWLLAIALAASEACALPPADTAVIYRSGNPVTGVGSINSPFLAGFNAGEGFLGLAINNSGDRFVHVSIYADPGFDEAVLDLAGGLGVPYLAAGVEWSAGPYVPGSVNLPSDEYVVDQVFSTAINSAGTGAFILRLRANEFSSVPTTTGIYFNKSAMPIREGDAVTAAGVAPGSTFASFDSTSVVHINDSNLLLIGTRIIESGTPRRALLKVQLDAAGAPLSQALVAKEGGPVGPGPDTWVTVSVGPHTCALNSSGSVVHSGITAAGVNGVFINGAAVAQQGGSSPAAGLPWGPLAGAPVDINASGQWAVRAPVYGNDFWIEQGEAGETFTSGGGGTTGNVTIGGGPLRTISGTLASDHDVDVYYIAVGDTTLPVQEPFSITTVPDPGSGFAGAAFDTTLYLFRDFANANGAFRVGVGRSDDAAPGVIQSTLTPASLPNDHVPGTKYFLAIATPRSRPLGGSPTTLNQMWNDDPARFAIADGTLFWVDPGEGQLGRASLASGTLLSPLQVGVIPPQTVGQVAEDAPLLSSQIAALDAGPASKVYFIEQRFFPWRLKRCNTDGSGIETVRDTAAPGPSIFGAGNLSIDPTNSKIYWTQAFTNGVINRCDLDGTNAQTVITLDSTHPALMALDPVGGRIYYWEPVAGSFNRCNLDGSGNQLLAFPIALRSMTADVAGRTLYLNTSAGVIRRYNLDTSTFAADLATPGVLASMIVDSAAGQLYWPNSGYRQIRRAALLSPTITDWLNLSADTTERPSDGPAFLSAFNSWTRSGTPVATPLPYHIRLSGATFVNPLALIARSGVKIAIAGEPLPSTAPDPITNAGALTSPVRLTDTGLVAWRGRWTSTVAPTGTRTAIFLNGEEVFRDNANPNAGGSGPLGTVPAGPYAFDLSPSGQRLIAFSFNGAFVGINGNACILTTFTTPPPPACRADFNSSGAVTVQDIFDFLAAYFTSSPSADINSSGSVTVQDIFDFLALYFAGCP